MHTYFDTFFNNDNDIAKKIDTKNFLDQFFQNAKNDLRENDYNQLMDYIFNPKTNSKKMQLNDRIRYYLRHYCKKYYENKKLEEIL